MWEEGSGEAIGWGPLTRAALCPPHYFLLPVFFSKRGHGQLCHFQKLRVG